MNLKVSEKDLKLLFIIGIIAVIFAAYMGNTKLSEMNKESEKEVAELQKKYDDLKEKHANKKDYEEKTANNLLIYQGVMDRYANGLDQEHIIMSLKAAEDATGTWIKSASLSGVSNVKTFGSVLSTDPSRAGQRVYNSDCIGVSSSLSVSYEGTYAQVKDLITYLNTHEDKSRINSMSMSYSEAGDLVSGSMQLTSYGIVGSEREFAELQLRSVRVGTDNIFNSSSFESTTLDGDYGQQILTNYDIFLMLNSDESDMETVAIGTSDDIDGSKTLVADSNTLEDVTIRISGENGAYKISYRLGSDSFPEDNYADGVDFVCGETLDLLVMSSARTGSNDNAGAEVQIINNSDLTLNYKVVGDDAKEPRFSLGKVTGQIIGY